MIIVDRLVASDPPLERLRLSVRSTLAVLLAGALVLPAMKANVIPGTSALLGTLMGMWATLVVNDRALRDRRVTSVLVPLSAAAAVTLASLFDVRAQVLGALVFVAVTFAGVWVRRYGPRGFAVGQAAIFAMLFSLFLRIEPAQLPATYLALLAGGAAAFVVRYGIVRDDARLVFHAALTALAARVRLFEAAVAAIVRGEEPAPKARLRREAVALNDAALAVDRLLTDHIFALGTDERRHARIALLEMELAVDAFGEAAFAHRADVALDAPHPPEPVATARAAMRERIASTRAELHRVAHAPLERGADAPISAMPSPPRTDATEPTTHLAAQAATAAALSMLLGSAVPPHLYFWAVLTAFLVYNGTASAAEARGRAWGRSVGTALGVALGFVMIAIVHANPVLEIAIGVVSFFLAMYTFRVSYAAFTFFITALVAVMYELVGRPAGPLLIARLVETVVGTFCGAIAATLVLPLRTRDVVAVRARDVAGKLAAAVQAAAGQLSGTNADDPLDAARALDGALQELLGRMRPLRSTMRGTARAELDATTVAFYECGAHTRDLCDRALRAPAVADGSALPLRRAADAIAGALRAFATIVEGRPDFVPDDVAPANAAETTAAHESAPPDLAAAAHDLRLIAEDVALLAAPASWMRKS